MPDVKLWYASGACSLAPHILLHEIRIPFEAVETSVAKGANLTAEFARINPKKRVPVLAVDDAIITEVPAITTAITYLAPQSHLMGRTPLDRARVYEWMNWLSGTLHGQGFGALWRPERFSDDPTVFDSLRAKARITISACFETIEARIAGPWSVGNGFTAADAFLLVFYRWGNGIGVDMAKTYPRYSDFAGALVRRDSVVSALAAEGIADRALADHVPLLKPD